ncbi:helix-turn-helix domain-containing protein [Myroides pelagicus]|uniref:Helix-turn-helix domain-containing protein n=1 Tax=Myroides pelagicus TaxID=270914 RepID=A0A7K1GQ48_9FLAO|nr:helix-turn-helix domain-containing protein [Myroides pelagicus]MTH30987.1 helix-turn-helix domain-containing protein [Myroides pelagicus]
MLSKIELKSTYGIDVGTASYLMHVQEPFTQHKDVYQLLWLEKGEVTITLPTNQKLIKQGDCLFLGKNELFRLTAHSPYSLCYVQFTDSFYCRTELDKHFLNDCKFFDNSKAINSINLKEEQLSFAHYYVRSLIKLNTEDYSDINYMLAHNIVERMLLFIINCHIDKYVQYHKEKLTPLEMQYTIRFNELLRKDVKHQRSVNYYAKQMNISVAKLTQISKEVFGSTPKKVINSVVVNEIKLLLKHTPLTVKEIAFELNFEDVSNFIRFFSTTTGMSPTEYRELK